MDKCGGARKIRKSVKNKIKPEVLESPYGASSRFPVRALRGRHSSAFSACSTTRVRGARWTVEKRARAHTNTCARAPWQISRCCLSRSCRCSGRSLYRRPGRQSVESNNATCRFRLIYSRSTCSFATACIAAASRDSLSSVQRQFSSLSFEVHPRAPGTFLAAPALVSTTRLPGCRRDERNALRTALLHSRWLLSCTEPDARSTCKARVVICSHLLGIGLRGTARPLLAPSVRRHQRKNGSAEERRWEKRRA